MAQLKRYDDNFVFAKLAKGEPLTAADIALVCNSDSPDNVIKQQLENAITNAELAEAYKEHEEDKLAFLECLLRSIEAYVEWKQNQKQVQMQATAQAEQQQSFEEFSKESAITRKSAEEHIDSFLRSYAGENMHELVKSNINDAVNDRNSPIDMRAIKAVMNLAKDNDALKKFLFPEERTPGHDDHAHAQRIANNILYAGATLKHMHAHELIKQIESLQEKQQTEKPTSPKSTRG